MAKVAHEDHDHPRTQAARTKCRKELAELSEAYDVVIDDVHKSYPDMTPAQAVSHVYNTIDPDSLNEDDPSAEAYRLVLDDLGQTFVEASDYPS